MNNVRKQGGVFVSGRSFQTSLMFVSKASARLSEVPFRCSTLGQAPGLIHEHQTRLERLAGTNTLAFNEHLQIRKLHFITLDTRGQCYRTFYGRNLRMFVVSQGVALGRPFQPSIMFADKARSLPKSVVPERCSSVIGCNLTRKHYTKFVKLDRNKRSSL